MSDAHLPDHPPLPVLTLARYEGGSLERARAWMDEGERRRLAVLAARDRDLETLWSLTEAHLTLHSGAAGSRHTLRTYRNGLRLWLLFTGRAAVSLLRPRADEGSLFVRELEAGKLHLKRASKNKPQAADSAQAGRPLSASSVNAYLAGARSLYRALRWAGATSVDPFLDVRPRADKVARWDKRQPYPQAAIEALLKVGDARHRVTVLLGAHAGLRASEIVRLRRSDVDVAAGRLRVVGKGDKVRVVNLSASLRRELAALLVGPLSVGPLPGSPLLVGPPPGSPLPDSPLPGAELVIGGTPESARLRLRRACLHVGVPFLSLHALRHSAGTRLVRSGRTLQDVARHLGHASVATAEIYAKWADESLQNELDNW
ncbi:site-specific integrase [Deinococcus sp.]|uniref:tyrosine-type recombinase/integrase n=1 Tax=Deinococcus sp. TaxID=47478 RepID=UPI0025FE8D92|nr:site-specific integrase [Deinococcus sp.]